MQAKSLPTRGGGGGPIRYADAPNKQLAMWDELWWDDGLYHSQPVLDGTLEPQLQSPGATLRQLGLALSIIGASIYACTSLWSEKQEICVPQQYPPEVLEAFTSRGKVQWVNNRAP